MPVASFMRARSDLTIKTILCLIAIGLASWIGWNWQLASRGYCFEEQRFLGDRELLLRGMSMASSRIDFGSSDQEREQFLTEYPQCCQVNRRPHWMPFSGRMDWGLYDVYFLMEGPHNASPEYRRKWPFYRVDVLASACARSVGSYEFTDPPLKPLNWYKPKQP